MSAWVVTSTKEVYSPGKNVFKESRTELQNNQKTKDGLKR